MSFDLKLGKVKSIKAIGKHSELQVSFENGMDFTMDGHWRYKSEKDGRPLLEDEERFEIFKKEGIVALCGGEDENGKPYTVEEYPEYFVELYKPWDIYAVHPEIQKMVVDAVLEHCSKLPDDHKGIKIFYRGDLEKTKSEQVEEKPENKPENAKPDRELVTTDLLKAETEKKTGKRENKANAKIGKQKNM